MIACSRLSDSGKHAKVKGKRKVCGAILWGRKKEPSLPSFLPFYFCVRRRFLNSAGPTYLGAWNRLIKFLFVWRFVNRTQVSNIVNYE